MEGGEDRGPRNTGWVEDMIDRALGGRCGEVDKLDDALGSVVNREPRDSLVELGKNTDRVCTLRVQIDLVRQER